MSGISTLLRSLTIYPQSLYSLPHKDIQHKDNLSQMREPALPGTTSNSILILDFPGTKARRSKSFLFKPPSLWSFVTASPCPLKHWNLKGGVFCRWPLEMGQSNTTSSESEGYCVALLWLILDQPANPVSENLVGFPGFGSSFHCSLSHGLNLDKGFGSPSVLCLSPSPSLKIPVQK